MSTHRIVRIWQERPEELSWRCECGLVTKHARFPGARQVGLDVPPCPDGEGQ